MLLAGLKDRHRPGSAEWQITPDENPHKSNSGVRKERVVHHSGAAGIENITLEKQRLKQWPRCANSSMLFSSCNDETQSNDMDGGYGKSAM